VTSIEVAPGRTFRLVDGGVVEVAGGASRALPATSPPGTAHALAQSPHGLVLVAADAGLFVCDAQHAVLDPADLRDGVVPGPLVGVVVDARNRAWLCSPERFGVVDLRLRFGRTFREGTGGDGDGVPAGPFRGLALEPDGAVRLHTERGDFVYRPDQGPGPVLRASTPDGAPLTASADGVVELQLDVDARGGATTRLRRRHHHLMQPLADGRVVGLRPGRHVLEVYAFDRDLRSAHVREYVVDVPVPGRFDPRLVLVLLGGCVGVLLVVAWRTGEPGPLPRRLRRTAARVAVLTVVLLQLAAAVSGYGRSWPFVGFSMYTENWHEGDTLYRPRIVGLRSDGVRVPLHEDALGVVQDGYWQMLAEVVFGPELHRRELMQRVANHRHDGPPFLGFVLADGRIRLTERGPVDVAPTVLLEYRP
jgi:hypothetical protein